MKLGLIASGVMLLIGSGFSAASESEKRYRVEDFVSSVSERSSTALDFIESLEDASICFVSESQFDNFLEADFQIPSACNQNDVLVAVYRGPGTYLALLKNCQIPTIEVVGGGVDDPTPIASCRKIREKMPLIEPGN